MSECPKCHNEGFIIHIHQPYSPSHEYTEDCPLKCEAQQKLRAHIDSANKRARTPEKTENEILRSKLTRLEAALEEVKTVLEFYRDEDNWTKGIVEACSPIIADTGTKARVFLEKYFGGNNENAM